MSTTWENEIERGERFEFGANWASFLQHLDQNKIERAKRTLLTMLQTDSLEGKTFLDIGSGSGIHSLAARMAGANVFSFDYDMNSIKCTQFLKDTYFKDDKQWHIERGSALDPEYLESLGKFDIVYSWGVLHHTGDMYQALENATIPVKPLNGKLFIAIYNTQLSTPIWKWIKKTYVKSPKFFKFILNGLFALYFAIGLFFADILRGINPRTRYLSENRGMSFYIDVVDWIGGYPFETATPAEIFEFYKKRGFSLEKLVTVGGKMGCNEFIFSKATTC